jgi:Fe-S oxidoreductase
VDGPQNDPPGAGGAGREGQVPGTAGADGTSGEERAVKLAIGLIITLIGFTVAGRRIAWLVMLIRDGQPASGRFDGLPRRLRTELREVAGQSKLLTWSVPGIAHFFTMWGFIFLMLTIVELYGSLFDETFAIPLIGRAAPLGLLEDLAAVTVLVALAAFTVLRLAGAPSRIQRRSRFYGSHLGSAWTIIIMITLVILLLLVWRGAQINTGHFPFGETWWAFASMAFATLLRPLGTEVNGTVENVLTIVQIGVLMVFLAIVVYSKHLHIGTAPINVLAKREPKALGALLPMESDGKLIDFEDPGDDDVFGRGAVEDFTWKGRLDFATCTECGRCQSQCPAWNTGKPLSPKLLIMDLRDHLFAKAPHILGSSDGASNGAPNGAAGSVEAAAEAARPLVGSAAEGGVIDPDVLWSCTTCGACVEQCPVDIEHVDHIVDMRRNQVLMESAFPSELGGVFKNLENSGNPWGVSARTRLEWTEGLGFDVPVVGVDVEDLTAVDYLFWVGCAGATEDRSKRTTRAVAELLHLAGVSFAILGEAESCTGDSARRAGNEFLFQMLAQQNIETLNEARANKIIATCPHCLNTLKNEYPQLGGTYEVIHHTQLLNELVREGRLTPVAPPSGTTASGTASSGTAGSTVTYHDPCYLGRHNEIYSPPRELIASLPGVTLAEMPRNSSRSFCCGAGGARMWMEEDLGTRINDNRAAEAMATGADTVSVACPFCLVMLSDGVTDARSSGQARDDVAVTDVAQLLLTAVKRGVDEPRESAEQSLA